jgi:hypothetical protein
MVDPAAPPGAKWHPGHYALVSEDRYRAMAKDPALAAEFEAWVASLPKGIVGVQGGAYWVDLEAGVGVYDFSLIEAQLEICQRRGKRLFCTIGEKIFNSDLDPAPAYIWERYQGIVPFTPARGSTARIWDPRVLAHFKGLLAALGARFDDEPYLEGIEFMETSFSCDPIAEKGLGYDADDYVQAYKDMLLAARTAFPSTVIIQETNWLPYPAEELRAKMEGFFAYCESIGVGVGGPDLYPDSQRDARQNRVAAYEFFPRWAGRIPLASDVQRPQYEGKFWYDGELVSLGSFTPQGILDMGIDTLKLNYIFWSRQDGDPSLRFEFKRDVIPTLERNHWPIHSAWPSALGG